MGIFATLRRQFTSIPTPKKQEAVLHPEIAHVTVHVVKMPNGVALRVESQEQGLTLLLPKHHALEMVDAMLEVLDFEAEATAS
jgi:hypothetical protein